jgi:eukaryotic-like serine/threonine-protein kinase
MTETSPSGRWKRLPTLERVPRVWGDPGPLVRLLADYDAQRTPTVRPIGSLTAPQFLQLLRHSALIEEKVLAPRLQAWDEELAESGGWAQAGGVEIAQRLVTARLLSVWQAEKLLAGKYKGFSLANYRMVELLGVSPWGAVYRAEHQMMRRLVAMEVLAESVVAQPGARERFFRSTRKAAELDHPNLVHVFDIGEERDMCYAVMEFVAGYDLQRLIRRLGPLPQDLCAGIVRQIGNGLLAIHAARHSLGGLRPRHVILDPNGVAHLLTLRLNDTSVQADQASPTEPPSASAAPPVDGPFLPGAWHPESTDRQRDVFAMGALFYYLLLAEPPAVAPRADPQAPVQLDLAPLAQRPELDPRLLEILGSLTTLGGDTSGREPQPAWAVRQLTEWLADTAS